MTTGLGQLLTGLFSISLFRLQQTVKILKKGLI